MEDDYEPRPQAQESTTTPGRRVTRDLLIGLAGSFLFAILTSLAGLWGSVWAFVDNSGIFGFSVLLAGVFLIFLIGYVIVQYLRGIPITGADLLEVLGVFVGGVVMIVVIGIWTSL